MANRRYIDFPIASTSGDTDIILIWQDGANKQTTKATFLSGLPENLDELNDVAISGLTNGQILRYDSVTGKWENTDQGNLDLNDLNDVSIVSPSNGQVLVYNSSTSKWENSSGGYVPYVGAVTTVDLGAQGLRAGYVRFDTTVAGVPNEQGLMFWDADDETVDIILNGYTMKIGEDLFYPVKNQTGSTIAKGVAVRFNGTVGASGRLLIAPFIADGSVPSSRFMGVTAEEILNGEDGKVLYFGRVRGINTNAFNEGDILYASTTVAGGYQTAIPLPPNNIVQVAAVVTKSATVGTIFVRPTLGSNINTDEGVKITSVADKNLLQYQSGTSLWENKSLAQVLGGTSAQFVKGDGSLDSSTYGTGTVTSVGLSSATSGVTIGSTPVTTSGTITLAIATASGSQNGLLSSTDWTTFNNKQNALTNPVTGTGVSGRVAFWNGTNSITSDADLLFDGSNVDVGGNIVLTNGANRFVRIGSASNYYYDLQTTGDDFQIIEAATTPRLTIKYPNGNFLINSISDNGAKFQVTNGNGISFSSRSGASNLFTYAAFGRTSDELAIGIAGAADQFFTGSVAGDAVIKALGTNNRILLGYGINTALTITSSGNVGIGTSSPSNFNGLSFASPILDVSGSIQIKGIAANGIAALQFGGETYRKALIYSSIAADTPYLAFGIGSSGSSSSASEVMRINSSGFLKASNTGTYASSTGTYHELINSVTGNNIAYLWNTSANPYGPYIRFSAAAPNNGTNYYFYCDDTSAARFIVYSNGGISNYQANNTNLSDERTKKEIAPLESYWDKFKAIEIVKFKYKDQTHDDFNIGVIAQQVEKVAPEFVDVDGWDNKTEGNEVVSKEEPIKSIYTADLHHATIKVLQEAMAKIESMQKEIETLKN